VKTLGAVLGQDWSWGVAE